MRFIRQICVIALVSKALHYDTFHTDLLFLLLIIDLLPKSHNAPVPFPTMHHFNRNVHMCYKMVYWGYLCDALWDLLNGSIARHCSNVTWASWCLKSIAPCLFSSNHWVKHQRISNLRFTCPLRGKFPGNRILFTKGRLCCVPMPFHGQLVLIGSFSRDSHQSLCAK